MKQVTYVRRYIRSSWQVFVLALALSASSAFAQRAGHWFGMNSFGYPMDFDVSDDGLTSYTTGAVRMTCPSGAEPLIGFGGRPTPIVDGSFRDEVPLVDGAFFPYVFFGWFFSDTQAEGNFHLLMGTIRLEGKEVGSQLCTSDSTWRATWQSFGAADHATAPVKPNRGYIQVMSE